MKVDNFFFNFFFNHLWRRGDAGTLGCGDAGRSVCKNYLMQKKLNCFELTVEAGENKLRWFEILMLPYTTVWNGMEGHVRRLIESFGA